MSGAKLVSSLELFYIARLPAFVDRRLGGTVEPQDREISFTDRCREPVV